MKRVALPEQAAETLFGNRDENLRFLEENLKVRIKNDGEDVVAQLFDQLGSMIKDGYAASPGDVRVAAQLLSQDPSARLRDFLMKAAIRGAKKVVVPRSLNQRAYLEELEKNDMVFGIGPAGTGKTYLAVAQAVSSLLAKSVARIVVIGDARVLELGCRDAKVKPAWRTTNVKAEAIPTCVDGARARTTPDS